MAKFYGDLPCVKLGGVIHLTVSGSRCAFGHHWYYHVLNRNLKFHNIIWRDKAAFLKHGYGLSQVLMLLSGAMNTMLP